MTRLRSALVAALLTVAAAPALAQQTIYADADATGAGSGASWADAFTDLQAALDALQPGDTLHSRGAFPVGLDIDVPDTTWLGSEDPADPTWLRGDTTLTGWEEINPSLGIWRVEGVSTQLASDAGIAPGSVVFDYQRDTLEGAITGVDLRRVMDELPGNGAGVYFGHLPRAADLIELAAGPNGRGAWFYDTATDELRVRLPEGRAFDAQLVGVCANRVNGVDIGASGVRISGVNTVLTPGFSLNTGYGFKGVASIDGSTIENADIIDSGWHAAGFATAAPTRCTLRNIRAWSSGVDGSNLNNPFVFYANERLPDAGHLAEDLTFVGYPLLGVDGSPIYAAFRPRLGLSHGAFGGVTGPGDIEWKRCRQFLFESELEARHGVDLEFAASSIVASEIDGTPSGLAEDAEFRVSDSYFEGAGPGSGIAWVRTAFLPTASGPDVREAVAIGSDTWLVACTIDVVGPFSTNESAVFSLSADGLLHMDLTSVRIRAGNNGMQLFRTGGGGVVARQNAFVTEDPAAIVFSWPGGWSILSSLLDCTDNLYSGFTIGARHSNPGVTPRTLDWWEASVDPLSTMQAVALTDGTLAPASALPLAAALLPDLVGTVGIDGEPYAAVFGAHQARCRADTNGDGLLSPADFNAWVIAFNSQTTACDQNGDTVCSPADFNAWVLNFNAGCP